MFGSCSLAGNFWDITYFKGIEACSGVQDYDVFLWRHRKQKHDINLRIIRETIAFPSKTSEVIVKKFSVTLQQVSIKILVATSFY